MKIILKIFLWLLIAFLLIGTISEFPSITSFLLLLAVALIAPISTWQKILRKKLKLRGWMKGIAATLLFVVGMSISGASTNADIPLLPEPSVVISDYQPDVSSKPSDTGSETDPVPSNTMIDTPAATGAPIPSVEVVCEPSAPLTTPSTPENSTFSIHFIDVGQADAALVECDGHFMLVDGGNKADSNTIYSVLKKHGADHLDIVVGTHGHEDHIGGLSGAFNYASADVTLCPVTSYDSDAFESFAKYANQNSGGITVPSVGDQYTLGSAMVTILGVNSGSDANDTSIVLKIQYGDTSFLFTGDAEREAEQTILNSGVNLSATVLKVGHHGSDSSTNYVFLREIMPVYAVISVGEGNSYGHPTEVVLSRLKDAGATVFRTDLQGDVYCTSDGKKVSFNVDRNLSIDTFAPVTTPTSAQSPHSTATPKPTPEPTSTPMVSEDPEPVGMDYILNTNTMKFHYPSCSSVKRMSDKNKGYFTGSREDLIMQGYSPCGNCHP